MQYQWDIRDRKIRDDTRNYSINFMKISMIAKEAEIEGWEHYLRRYVNAVAYVHAQFVHGQTNFGIDWHIVLIDGYDEKERYGFMQKAKFDSRQGINVAIPTGKITHWKKMAELEKQKYGNKIAA